MPSINILDPTTVSKIAAGEVVERPLSVVKELVENSIDAGATEISITLEDGGHRLIRVSDNGCGMSREDAALCLKSHTTSKLREIEDMERIVSLGFRGEALNSIGAVSRLSVLTSDGASDSAWLARMDGGDEKPLEQAARVKGSTVEVENLFFNVPARRKFLKTSRAEISAISSMVSNYIIGRPEIGFELIHNDKRVFKTSPGEDHAARIEYVMGKNIAGELVHYTASARQIGLNVWFSLPDLTFPGRKYQVFFVNGRSVRDRSVTVAVDAAYRGLAPSGRHGLAILFLDMPASDVDANVHPTKTEVRFANTHEVHSLIYRTLRGRFVQNEGLSGVPTLSLAPPPGSAPHGSHRSGDERDSFGFSAPPAQREVDFGRFEPTDFPPPRNREIDLDSDPSMAHDEAFMTPPLDARRANAETARPGLPEGSTPVNVSSPQEFQILGQFYNTFIMAQMDGAPVFIDQHVASERIIYNRLKRSSVARGAQMHLISQPVELPVDVYEILRDNLDKVKKIGLEIEPFGDRAFVIRSTTHNSGAYDPVSLLVSVAEEIKSAPLRAPDDILLEKLLVTASCKMAVKAGQELNENEMKSLVEQLLQQEYNRTCPHGRPIIYSISQELLNSWFKR